MKGNLSLISEYRAGSGEVLTDSGHDLTGKPGGAGFAGGRWDKGSQGR